MAADTLAEPMGNMAMRQVFSIGWWQLIWIGRREGWSQCGQHKPDNKLGCGVVQVAESSRQLIIWGQTLVGSLEQLGCWLTPVCQVQQAAKSCIITMAVMCPMLDVLSTKQQC